MMQVLRHKGKAKSALVEGLRDRRRRCSLKRPTFPQTLKHTIWRSPTSRARNHKHTATCKHCCMAFRITRILQTKRPEFTTMNRPRNGQSRPTRGQSSNSSSRGQHRGGSHRGSHTSPRPAYSSVPGIDKVVAGSSVSIVLKQDQPTGREVQGVVQDLLTRGNHPRGIKVRLSDGRVGRVQRMAGDGTAPKPVMPQAGGSDEQHSAGSFRETQDEPPPRTLADYIQFPSSDNEQEPATRGSELSFTTATAKCPICGLFEGDEIAVSRHAEEHFV